MVEKQSYTGKKETELKKECQHPLDELLHQKTGLYACFCGAEGTLAAGPDRKLVFTLQTPKQNRASKRRVMRGIMKTMKKARKQQLKRKLPR